MADRVHPGGEDYRQQQDEEQPLTVPSPSRALTLSFPAGKPSPPPGIYVVQFPKDAILRPAPPPRNYHKSKGLRRRRHCCCCFFFTLLTLIILTGIFLGIFFLVFRPKSPKYSIDKLSIQDFNLNSSSSSSETAYSPKINVTVTARNTNTKLSIYYTKGSSVSVTYAGAQLCNGVLPVFRQPSRNVTVFKTWLKSSQSVLLSTGQLDDLKGQEKRKFIPLRVDLKVPVKFKVGSVKTWTISVKVRCFITVDGLSNNPSILSNRCHVDVKPWK